MHCSHIEAFYRHQHVEAKRLRDYGLASITASKAEAYRAGGIVATHVEKPSQRKTHVWHAKDFPQYWMGEKRRRKFKLKRVA